jgi:thiamine-monophosphate kinase
MADDAESSGEFHRIAAYLRPLTRGMPGALDLRDDAALMSVPAGRELVLTADTLVEGVHFIGDEPPDRLARKALRVNLSDLAAMGAKPTGYLLSMSLPARIGDDWVAGFCEGLAADQAAFGWALLGGDSTATPGPVSIAVTALGTVEAGAALQRAGGRAGDALYVSGTVGDGFLGLLAAQNRLAPGPEADSLAARYHLPEPRVALGLALIGRAHAALDISDGLVADLAHLCRASGVGARVDARSVPLSAAAASVLAGDPDLFPDLLTGGDDYELLIAGPAEAIEAAAAEADTRVTHIGMLEAGEGVRVLDADGNAIAFARPGYRHGG